MVGRTLGGYRLDEQIGKGAFGKVYRAVHVDMDRVAAVKVAREARFGQMLVSEGKLLAKLSHPNIVDILHMDAQGDPPFVVMEYVDGESLAARLQRGPLSARQAIKLALPLLAALTAAHELGILHRDIKPSNILIAADGTPKLADFGLGRVVAEESLRRSGDSMATETSMRRSQVSQPGSEGADIVGTIAYMSPEQMDGQSIDARSDLYSFGVVLYEAVTGKLPVGRFKLPGELFAGVPEQLDTLLDALLAPEPAERPESAAAARVLLSGHERVTVTTKPVSRLEPESDEGEPWERAGSELGEEIVGPHGGVMVWVPGGSFRMGTRGGFFSRAPKYETPVHRVEVDGFWLGKTEVTVGEWRSVMGSVPGGNNDQGDNHPVVSVQWRACREFCRRMGLELPTEAQWEYAARGPESRVYPWGDSWDASRCCSATNAGPGGQTYPVGSFPSGVSWCGAHDMAGNVSEWCLDWYYKDYYRDSPMENPGGPSWGRKRVARGGSWSSNAYHCRSACRLDNAANDEWRSRGFRVSRSVC